MGPRPESYPLSLTMSLSRTLPTALTFTPSVNRTGIRTRAMVLTPGLSLSLSPSLSLGLSPSLSVSPRAPLVAQAARTCA